MSDSTMIDSLRLAAGPSVAAPGRLEVELLGPLDEQDANPFPLAGERQARLLLQVPEDRGPRHDPRGELLGEWLSQVVIPGDLPLRWGLDLADDRSPDPIANPIEELREIAGAAAGPAATRDDLLAVDLDFVRRPAFQGGMMIRPACDDDIALDTAERERDPQPEDALDDHLECVDRPLGFHAIPIDPVAGDPRLQQIAVAVDLGLVDFRREILEERAEEKPSPVVPPQLSS